VSAVVYWILWFLFAGIARLLFRYRTVGAERIPSTGGVIVAANHASYSDIPFLGIGVRRRVAFLGRQDLFPIPGARWVLRRLGWIPIRQDRLDRTGFGRAVELVNKGRVVVIFPEGGRTRTGRLQPGKPGVGTLVAETGCPVVPAFIAGSYDVLPMGARRIRFRPVTVRFGAPIDFAADRIRLPKKDFYRHVSRTVMARIAELGGISPAETHADTSLSQR
jgi:1-acyl-sn-glycerol-3-phosphate acyltransferase